MIFGGFQKLTLLDYPGKVACTVFTKGCNFYCPFCHNAFLVDVQGEEESISSEEVLSYLKKRQGVLDGICITGGEPLLHNEIKAFIKEVKALGFSVKLDTNGSFPEKLKNLLIWMNSNVKRMFGKKDSKKFNKTAEEILISKERTGCSDSAVLFSTIVRTMGIPAMQIITFDKDWGVNLDKGEDTKGVFGHFFVGVFVNDKDGNKKWKIIDSDNPTTEIDKINIYTLKKEDRNITKRRYAFAYVRDFRDIELDGIRLDSEYNMKYIQTKAYMESNRKDIDFDNGDVR